jgi:hypothetical protein
MKENMRERVMRKDERGRKVVWITVSLAINPALSCFGI